MFYFMTLVKIPVIMIQGWKIVFLLLWHSAQGKKNMIGKCLRQLLILMGPFYIKLGQVLSTRSDLLGRETIKELQRLQDEVPPMPQRHLKKIIKKAYPLELANYFEEFNWTPLASASIAQVHLASTCGGERVAVKVVRMHVARSMRQNLRMMRFAAHVVHWLVPRFRSIDPYGRRRQPIRRSELRLWSPHSGIWPPGGQAGDPRSSRIGQPERDRSRSGSRAGADPCGCFSGRG
jgi:predicted unusual protein kinase regulating ubiquinone biosynthesis (AarF/ABC1/UbiB family)